MTDTVDAKTRSKVMAKVKGTNTTPELKLRKSLFALGFRYRLHAENLPGKPDLVLPRYKAVIFVHGCFWHWHGCPRSRMPKSNPEYWRSKISRNVARDRRQVRELHEQGWRVLLVWECSLKPSLLGNSSMLVSGWLRANDGPELAVLGPTELTDTSFQDTRLL